MCVQNYSIIVFTDQKNNTFNGLKASDRVFHTCCHLLLEEYGVKIEHLPGKTQKNVKADALSRLDVDNLKSSRGRSATIMALKPYQQQITTHKQMQSLSEYTK
jgi:hypothetical protein